MKPALLALVLVSGISFVCFGIDTGVSAIALICIGSDLSPDGSSDDDELSTGAKELVVSSALAAAMLSSVFAGWASDTYGRKRVIILAAALFAAGPVVQGCASSLGVLVFGRALVGVGVGLASPVLPPYLAELAPSDVRGQVVASTIVLVTGGQVLAYALDAMLFTRPHAWRLMFASGAVPAVIQLVLAPFALIESPRWLLKQGRERDARVALERVYDDEHEIELAVQSMKDDLDESRRAAESTSKPLLGAAHTPLPTDEDAAVDDDDYGSGSRAAGSPLAAADDDKVLRLIPARLRATVSRLTNNGGALALIRHDRASRRALVCAMALQFFQQATGFNALMYYSGEILKGVGFANPAVSALPIALANFVCTIVALKLIDRVGRRSLLLRTIAGMVAGLFLMGIAFQHVSIGSSSSADTGEATAAAESTGAWASLSLLSMVLFCCSYGMGLGNVPWTVQSEIFTHELRAVGNALATATMWTGNLAVAATFLDLTQLLGPAGTFWLYGLVAIAAWLFTLVWLPETRGVELADVRELFDW